MSNYSEDHGFIQREAAEILGAISTVVATSPLHSGRMPRRAVCGLDPNSRSIDAHTDAISGAEIGWWLRG